MSTDKILSQSRFCTRKSTAEAVLRFLMAGVAGLEPTHAGFRIPCLTNLAIPL